LGFPKTGSWPFQLAGRYELPIFWQSSAADAAMVIAFDRQMRLGSAWPVEINAKLSQFPPTSHAAEHDAIVPAPVGESQGGRKEEDAKWYSLWRQCAV
jgi:hypothetical protein